MTWTAQLTYTAGDLTSDDIDALTDALGDALGDGGIVYGSDTGRLQITLELEAPTLQDAADTVLRTTARPRADLSHCHCRRFGRGENSNFRELIT